MSEGKKGKITDSLKFLLILIVLGLTYSFDTATINTASAAETKLEKPQTELSISDDHASLYVVDANSDSQITNNISDNRDHLYMILTVSVSLILLALFFAEVATRIY